MKSLDIIRKVLLHYQSNIAQCTTKEDIKRCEKDLKQILSICVEKYPHLLHPLCASGLSAKSVDKLFTRVKEVVRGCYIPVFPNGKTISDVIGDKVIITPLFDTADDNDNIFSDSNLEIGNEQLNSILLNILISMPIGKVNVTFIELGDSFIGDFFYQNISPKLYRSLIKDTDLRSYFDGLKSRMIEMQQSYGKYSSYCVKNQTVPVPYEIIVLPSHFNSDWHRIFSQDIDFISKNGKNAGIYIINLQSKAKISDPMNMGMGRHEGLHGFGMLGNISPIGFNIANPMDPFSDNESGHDELKVYINAKKKDSTLVRKVKEILANHRTNCTEIIEDKGCITFVISEHYELRNDNILNDLLSYLHPKYKFEINHFQSKNGLKFLPTLVKPKNILDYPKLLDGCIKYINSNTDTKDESIIIKQDYGKIQNSHYETDIDSIVLPIGRSNEDVYFRLDQSVNHAHAFILGQSGSGKSIFLHNIITNAMLKYAPEDLQIYLLDFKLGGVEFNRYKGVKHVRSLLVDNSDSQITLEILREIREYMALRAKALREAGVKDIVEFNSLNKGNRLPQIMIVVDECHAMFSTGSNIPRAISNEVSEITTMIAKEGRSQGVHLIMATQTLAGTDINSEILNNISVHYLLKCAASDSNRLVEGSSDITSKLSTGQIYCNVNGVQTVFKSFYIDTENAKQQILNISKKADNHQTNEKFYFNGMQLFRLDDVLIANKENDNRYPVAYIGKNISINQNDLSITLRKECGDNILLFGQNDNEQVTRSTMNIFLSLLFNAKNHNLNFDFKVINCLNCDDSPNLELLFTLESMGYCKILNGKNARGQFLKQLAEDIINETAQKTILFVLGQERFRELKFDMEFDNIPQQNDKVFGFSGMKFSSTSVNKIASFRQALEIILDKGPEQGVHAIMQLDKPSNYLFKDYVAPKDVYQKFKHLIMLKSEESAGTQLRINDNIRLQILSKDLDRLRAYHYSEESDSYTLFTPYRMLQEDELLNLLKLI